MHDALHVGDQIITSIDWEMTPDWSFGTYESWGGRERVRDNKEKIYYFFIDGWEEIPKVCLMERAVKHAKVLAEIDVPEHLVVECVKRHGWVARFERSFGLDDAIKNWIIENVLAKGGEKYVHPVVEKHVKEKMGAPLPKPGSRQWSFDRVRFSDEIKILREEDVTEIIKKWNFFDADQNTAGDFQNGLVRGENEETLVDERTGLQWQTGGVDICSLRMMTKRIAELNENRWQGHDDWRLPTLEEAMSLLEPQRNFKELYLAPCFSHDQPFVFVQEQRKPGGQWFVDYKQGRAFWASATIPGGFGRLCRRL